MFTSITAVCVRSDEVVSTINVCNAMQPVQQVCKQLTHTVIHAYTCTCILLVPACMTYRCSI